ncbi:MAG: DUF1275 family protein [Microbacterium sp.]|uniref:YoaK family protein n=1 Tax=Microbacterium sp. TaxID=51671 RepID=UPI00261FC3CE|nr:DUF1275 family protein [Microbacterium sp.]MCX6501551.1 DUF1275 family protein [Microbacterium sp.]
MAVAALAVLAGFVDGFGYVYLGGYFVSFMSGNTTRVGVGVAATDLATAGFGMLLIVAFIAGVMGGTALARPAGRHTSTLVLSLVAVALAAGAVLAALGATPAAAAALAVAMGAVNTTFSGGNEVSFGITYMTGALVKIGQGIVNALRGGSRTAWLRYVVLWVSILAGAVIGAFAQRTIGEGALWLAAAWVAVVATALHVVAARR